MSRFSRIETIFRKELTDTLRDRRTLFAMLLVPLILYPTLLIGTLQYAEVQHLAAQVERYEIAVPDAQTADWLERCLQTDIARRAAAEGVPAEQLPELREELRQDPPAEPNSDQVLSGKEESQRALQRQQELVFEILVTENIESAVLSGKADVGLILEGPQPLYTSDKNTRITMLFDQTEDRSARYAAPALEGILARLEATIIYARLDRADLTPDVLEPIDLKVQNVAPPERIGGSILGTIVPLILIMMTISGAIYPAIDLTAGERERGTLETLMVAPVPAIDLITGKFMVVTCISMLTATLNLVTLGFTIQVMGAGQLLAGGATEFEFPLHLIPLVLIILIPFAIMFSALLLAVASFARSFKEAQNYVTPVLVAGIVPAAIGMMPGTRLEGPLLVLPVTNIVVLTRDLFLGKFDIVIVMVVVLSTCLYAGAAVAMAARLFGQEAVLFADSGSIKSMFVRRFFKPAAAPSMMLVLLVTSLVYLGNVILQNSLAQQAWLQADGRRLLGAIMSVLIVLLGGVPLLVASYRRIEITSAFRLGKPRPLGLLAGVCFGCSTWLLVLAWMPIQARFMPMPEDVQQAFAQYNLIFAKVPLIWLLIALAVVPALIEEFFFRGFMLSGVRTVLGPLTALIVVSLAFAMFHQSVHRLIVTFALGLVLGLLSLRDGSIWPGMIAHLMHNGLSLLVTSDSPLKHWVESWGMVIPTELGHEMSIPTGMIVVCFGLVLAGLFLTSLIHRPEAHAETQPAAS
jgi:sodium transport system permease protein